MTAFELEVGRIMLLALVMSSLTMAGALLAYLAMTAKTEPPIPVAKVVKR